MKNKGDMLLKETLNLLIAVVVIGLLLILAYQLYGIFIGKHELEQARATIDAIVGKIESLGEGESTEYLIRAPKDWYIFSFKGDEGLECKGEACLCVCKSDKKEECQTKGVCKEVDDFEINNHEIQIVHGPRFNELDYIRIDSVPKSIYLKKSEKNIVSAIKFDAPILDDILKLEFQMKSGKNINLEVYLIQVLADGCRFGQSPSYVPSDVLRSQDLVESYLETKNLNNAHVLGFSIRKSDGYFGEVFKVFTGTGTPNSLSELKKLCEGAEKTFYIKFGKN